MIEILEQVLAAYSEEVNKRTETAEKQLGIAEKALIEKDKEIANLKKQLANQTSTVIADAKKDKKIKELEEQLAIAKNVNERWKKIHTTNKVRITELEQALKDLEGTLCVASDHFKELSNSIHTIVK